MLFLSIIIPVYNSEKYISKCLNSCISQSFDKTNYEILLVDDGSSDNSLKIIRDFEEREKNVRVFTQINQKQGVARNNGLKHAKGKYIWFVDSDDWIEKEAINKLFDFLVNKNLEVIRIDSKNYFDGKYLDRVCTHIPDYHFTGREVLIENKFSVSFPSHIFSRDFLIKNDLFFKDKIYFEDNELMVRVLLECKSFIYFNNYLYTVWIREESTTRTKNYTRYFDLIKVVEYQKELIIARELKKNDPKLFKALSVIIVKNINHCLVDLLYSNENEFEVAAKKIHSIKDLTTITLSSRSPFHIFQFFSLSLPKFLKKIMKIIYK